VFGICVCAYKYSCAQLPFGFEGAESDLTFIFSALLVLIC
jgi:hypothetical protein